jgi:DNA repair protein RadA/Sms
MKRQRTQFVCQACGAVHGRWAGRCDSCGEWNTLVEERVDQPLAGARGKGLPRGRRIRLEPLAGGEAAPPRLRTGIGELDRVCGGGLVPGSAILIGGDPGIGKSTLLLQALASMAREGRRCVYVSGEEALAQIRLRARRLGMHDAPVELLAETNVADIIATLSDGGAPEAVVIDSIQTLWSEVIESAPGTVTQLRAGSEALIRFAKKSGAVVLLVGHVTKEGQIAGPRVVEHMVDTVLYFEGDRGHQYRILRAVKNRFGPTDEIGVFEMGGQGLVEVENPSLLFLGESGEERAAGSAVLAGMEGARPLLVEVQALAAPTPLGTPRRAVVGWDAARLAMVLAVLETHAGARFSGHDVYLNVAGGLRVREPAADLAAAAALVSSLAGRPLPADTVVFGEIALSGVVRPVGQTEQRLREARKLGFREVITAPAANVPDVEGMRLRPVGHVRELVALVAGGLAG